MALLYVVASCIFSLVNGIAAPHPIATPRAVMDLQPNAVPIKHLNKRQSVAYDTIYSPVRRGSSITYEPYSQYSGRPISLTGTNIGGTMAFWNLCVRGGRCSIATTCQSGTLYYPSPGSSATCESTATLCGTDILFENQYATAGWLRPICAQANTSLVDVFLLTTPESGIATKTFTLTSIPAPSIPPNPQPTPPLPSPSTPVGAIVGGVIGGIAVLGAIVIIILLILRRRRSSPEQSQATQPPPTMYPQHHDKSSGAASGQYYDPNNRGSVTSAPPEYHSGLHPVLAGHQHFAPGQAYQGFAPSQAQTGFVQGTAQPTSPTSPIKDYSEQSTSPTSVQQQYTAPPHAPHGLSELGTG